MDATATAGAAATEVTGAGGEVFAVAGDGEQVDDEEAESRLQGRGRRSAPKVDAEAEGPPDGG